MAEFSKEQLSDAVARVLRDVSRETKIQEARAFGVADLHAHLSDLGRVGDAAWTISYSTSDASILERAGGAAWTISYSTSDVAVVKATERVSKK